MKEKQCHALCDIDMPTVYTTILPNMEMRSVQDRRSTSYTIIACSMQMKQTLSSMCNQVSLAQPTASVQFKHAGNLLMAMFHKLPMVCDHPTPPLQQRHIDSITPTHSAE